MKMLLLPFVILLASCQYNKPQEKPPTDTLSTRKKVAQTGPLYVINEKTQSIDAMEDLQKKLFSVDCGQKTDVEYSLKNNQVVRIDVGFRKEGDKQIKATYYFENDKLIYTFEIVRSADMDQRVYRSYIENDKVVRFFWDHGETNCKKCTFTASSKEYRLLKASSAAEIKAILCR